MTRTKKETLLRELKILNRRMQEVLDLLAEIEGLEEAENNIDQEEIEDRIIREFLHKLGCTPDTKCYCSAVDAIKIKLQKPKCKVGDIYQELADKNQLKYGSAERHIRYIRENVIKKRNNPMVQEVFGSYMKSGKSVTNSVFIALSAEYIAQMMWF